MIKEYDIEIYPCKLWITDETDVYSLNKKFAFCDSDNLYEETTHSLESVQESWSNANALTCGVINRKTKEIGIMVSIININTIDCKTIAHEAVHITDYIFQVTGMNSEDFSDGNEHYAYVVGWAAGCIFNFIKTVKDGRFEIR